MVKVLFVCLGNICRSPMAEFIMKELVKNSGLEDRFDIASAAVSSEEIGNPVYPNARRKLAELGISCAGKTACKLDKTDYTYYDYLIGMESDNITGMKRICGGDPEGKMHMLMDFTSRPGNIKDPWFTRDFNTTAEDISEGCRGLLKHIRSEHRDI